MVLQIILMEVVLSLRNHRQVTPQVQISQALLHLNLMQKKMNDNSEAIRQRNKDHAARRADMWVKAANDRINSLTKLLLTLVALIFTLSLPIITSTVNLDATNRVFLVQSWIANLVSLGIGVWSIWIDANYFADLANTSNESERIWSQTDKTNAVLSQEDDLNKKGQKLQTSHVPLYLQLLFVGISLVLLTVVGVRMLYF